MPSSIRLGAISALMVFIGVGCQPSPETTSTPDSTTDAGADPAIAEAVPETSEAPPEEAPVDTPESDITDDLAAYSELQCSAAAYVTDTDPAGLNVRSGPGSEFEVIDTLPTDGPVEVEITGSANGWLKLEIAWSLAQQELETPGWVYAPLLGVTTRLDGTSQSSDTAPLFANPDAASEVMVEIPQFTEVSLLSCSGPWIEVQSGETTGWLADENQCHSPVTTCP